MKLCLCGWMCVDVDVMDVIVSWSGEVDSVRDGSKVVARVRLCVFYKE